MSLSLVKELWETISLESSLHSEPAPYFGVYELTGLLLYFFQEHRPLEHTHTQHDTIMLLIWYKHEEDLRDWF